MDLIFERGDSEHPRGHAILYFRVDTEPDKVYATYVVTLPVKADLAKYIPPFLASQLGGLPLNDLSAFAMPPLPEPVPSSGVGATSAAALTSPGATRSGASRPPAFGPLLEAASMSWPSRVAGDWLKLLARADAPTVIAFIAWAKPELIVAAPSAPSFPAEVMAT